MKKRIRTITIWRTDNGYVYDDDFHSKANITMLEVFGMLISRLAATIQYSEDNKEKVEYQIEITKLTE